MKSNKEPTDIGAKVDSFLVSVKMLHSRLIGRETEVDALTHGLLTKTHVLLEGPPGTAKTQLARTFFSIFNDKDAFTFSVQLAKGSPEDKLFGPVNIGLLREKSEWQHNTHRMLPEATFAFIDEVYRGSDGLLPSLFSVLNEREFYNGKTTMKCPLMCAVGTTNFVTDNPELEAFHDRWLIKISVNPISGARERLKLYELVAGSGEPPAPLVPVPIETLRALQKAVDKVSIPGSVLELYDKLLTTLDSSAASSRVKFSVSDRRKCEVLKLVKAAAILRKQTTVDAQDLYSARFGLIQVGNQTEDTFFAAIYQRIVAQYVAEKEEREVLIRLGKISQALEESYDDDMSEDQKLKLHMKASNFKSLVAQTPTKFTTSENLSRFSSIQAQIDRTISYVKDSGKKASPGKAMKSLVGDDFSTEGIPNLTQSVSDQLDVDDAYDKLDRKVDPITGKPY